MIRTISVSKVHLLIAAAIVLFENDLHAQPGFNNSQPELTFSQKDISLHQKGPVKIKWSWRLPQPVKKAFDESSHASWYIEKIISYNSTGGTVYRFYINNGNLLDGDHHDSFLKAASIDISESGIILRN